ncbi:MAG: DNA-directed RNA polymerase subunit delta [Azospira oryzae]|jgi:S-adenosylmethionine hydrolase|nr:MAG: DNA-directed RNA polymerase subunit delta [Azospira oryzae]
MLRIITCLAITLLFFQSSVATAQSKALVFQSDFGLKDGAVSAMKGVAYQVSSTLDIFDITHEIPAYNIWEASYRLHQTVTYWPSGTVFVSIVDPGVGSDRKSVVLKTKSGHYIVTPDNGTLTLIAESLGIEAVRAIDESRNRRKGSEQSYTFHGRDVYAYTGARLAAGIINFEGVGPLLPAKVEMIAYQKAAYNNGVISGNIPILDTQYGNVWTNIDKGTFDRLGAHAGDVLVITIQDNGKTIFSGTLPYVNTFSAVPVGENLGYLNSLLNFSLGVNQENFSEKYKVFNGPTWSITMKKK